MVACNYYCLHADVIVISRAARPASENRQDGVGGNGQEGAGQNGQDEQLGDKVGGSEQSKRIVQFVERGVSNPA